MVRYTIQAADSPVVMENVTDLEELARARMRHKRFDRNLAWYQAHALELGAAFRGQHICIAGEEVFVADTAQEVLTKAKTAHPDDDGFYLKYIFKNKMERIYANQWTVTRLR
jgi:hypothetical protein